MIQMSSTIMQSRPTDLGNGAAYDELAHHTSIKTGHSLSFALLPCSQSGQGFKVRRTNQPNEDN